LLPAYLFLFIKPSEGIPGHQVHQKAPLKRYSAKQGMEEIYNGLKTVI